MEGRSRLRGQDRAAGLHELTSAGRKGAGPADGPLFHRLDLGSRPARAQGVPRLTVNGAFALVRRRGDRAGLSKPTAPHQLRHVAITTALDRTGGDVRAVARFSRHRSVDVVARYDDNRRDLGGAVAELVAGDDA